MSDVVRHFLDLVCLLVAVAYISMLSIALEVGYRWGRRDERKATRWILHDIRARAGEVL